MVSTIDCTSIITRLVSLVTGVGTGTVTVSGSG